MIQLREELDMNVHTRPDMRLLLAIAGIFICFLLLQQPAAGAQANEAMLPVVTQGYEVPEGIQLYRPRGTGRTTGHIATITVENNSDEAFELPSTMFYVPSGNSGIQGYVGRPVPGHSIAAGATADIPIEGYCSTVRLPPAPDGADLPPPQEWIVATGEMGPVTIAPGETARPPGKALVPGTDTPLPRAISQADEPLVAVPLLFAAITEIERATAKLQESGELVTPFAADPGREREAVNQQTFWIFAAELENEPYTREEFTERLEAQYESNTGVPITEAPEEDQERVQQGADDFWGAFTLVGAEAKVINVEGAAAGAAAQGTQADPADDATAGAVAEGANTDEVVPPACESVKVVNHTPRAIDVTIADSYGDDETRKKITDGLRATIRSGSHAYTADTPPSTAYAIWWDDHIGGIASGYAKSVFLENGGQEWVWSTEAISAKAQGTGIHTLSFQHGPECSSVVAGAATMWLKASSDAFDPLENSIEYFRALDAAKELSVQFATRKLPPGISDGIEAGVDAITDPSSDTYASAMGASTLTVGARTVKGEARNNVVYKREDKEDKAIIGGGETIRKIGARDQKPRTLTSKIAANAELKAGAEGNGYAKSNLESVYGTLLVGVCECPTGIVWDFLTDTSQLTQTEAANEAVARAKKEMREATERIGADIGNGSQQTDGDSLSRRAEAELARWAKSIGGDRFEEAEPDAEQQPGK